MMYYDVTCVDIEKICTMRVYAHTYIFTCATPHTNTLSQTHTKISFVCVSESSTCCHLVLTILMFSYGSLIRFSGKFLVIFKEEGHSDLSSIVIKPKK